jgi:hypothetical protein
MIDAATLRVQTNGEPMSPVKRIAALALTLTFAGCASTQRILEEAAGEVVGVRTDGNELRKAMRELWSEHVIYTREYIIAATSNSASASSAAARLMKNQEDIGNAIKPYYGDAAGGKLTSLLKDHINIAVDLVAAAKMNDNVKLAAADKRWRDNASDIATFLAGANPNWSRNDLVTMLNEHLTLTTQEATARLQGRWADDVATFDKIYDQALHMADALSDGIIKQFPGKFV